MTGRAASRIAIMWIAIFGFWQESAHAWIESQVKGHSARIEVERDGAWIISHELILKLRGGPMKTLEIAGIGSDIEPLQNAVVRRAEEGSAGAWPVHLSSMEDGALRLGISAERGLRGGTYIFSFGYRTDKGRAIEADGGRTILTWVGPRLSSGVDSARVTFVVPHGEVSPELAAAVDGPSGNVLLGEVRKGVQVDEVDLIRAHVASGEPAVWRIAVDPQLFGPRQDPLHKLSPGVRPATSEPSWKRWSLPWSTMPWILTPALLWLLLVFSKDRAVLRAARSVDARPVPLLPMPTWMRAVLAAASVAGLVSAVFFQQLVVVLACLLGSLVLTTYLLPVRAVRPRGPGEWKMIEHLPREVGCSLPGAWFDVRSARGSLLFLGLMAVVLGTSYRILPRSNYLALMTLLSVPALLPLFFSGTRRDYPRTPMEQARPWYQYLKQALDPQLLGVELWGRSALHLDREPQSESFDESQPQRGAVDHWDEMRVRVVLHRAPQGLRALEVVFEERAGTHLNPAVLLRVREDSMALACLPKDISWQRGRAADERVAVLSPTVPTFSQTARLLRSLAKSLSSVQSPASNARKSAGKGHVSGVHPSAGMAM